MARAAPRPVPRLAVAGGAAAVGAVAVPAAAVSLSLRRSGAFFGFFFLFHFHFNVFAFFRFFFRPFFFGFEQVEKAGLRCSRRTCERGLRKHRDAQAEDEREHGGEAER